MRAKEEAAVGEPAAALLVIISIGVGALVSNIYYAQPLVASIAADIGIPADVAGSVVSAGQAGYGLGLLLLVCLADIVENKTLVLASMGLTIIGLAGAALSHSAAGFFTFMMMMGFCATGAQVLMPFIAHLVPPARRGRVVGNVMAGVLTGIMLARPVSLFVAGAFGWRVVFWSSAVLIAVIALALALMMPRHQPRAGLSYGGVLRSLLPLLWHTPELRWRAAYQALLFGAFNLLWTAAPVMLADHFGLSTDQIGLFALAAAGGALAAPLAGRLADRGLSAATTAGAMITVALGFWATGWAVAASALIVLVGLTLLIDGAVQVNQVVSQRIIFSISADTRGRLNALFMTAVFTGGAVGSMLGTLTYHAGGWWLTAAAGAAMGAGALGLMVLEGRLRRR